MSIKLELEAKDIKTILDLLKISDPLMYFNKELALKIIKQYNEQSKQSKQSSPK